MDSISVTNEYISPKEAAERLAVSTGTIRRLIKGGELAAYRFGKQIRITVQSLDEYANRKK
jgi:excisionase family DNA binding protein